jgi:hypothetical protein
MKRLIIRVGIVVAIVAAAYLVVVNVALNLPATQAFLNSTQNGKLSFAWDRAWSWFPFRIHVTNLRLNGQSWSQQFDITAPEVSGAIDVPSLLTRTLRFNDIASGDLTVRFRPRPRPDKDDSELRKYYPEIPGRDPQLEAEAVPQQSPGWMFVFDIDRISGKNDLWLAANRMTLEGDATAFVQRQNKHGPLTVSDGTLDLAVTSLYVAGLKVSDAGTLAGTFGIASFIPQENRGAKVLEFLEMDAQIDLPIDGLDFLNEFLNSVADMTVNGRGRLTGRLALAGGALTPGADVTIEAEKLQVDLPPYAVYGTGRVVAKVDDAYPDKIQAQLGFANITAIHTPSNQPLFNGTDIGIAVVRSAIVFPEELREEVPRSVNMTLPSVSVPDISVYQRYLPDEWNAELIGGTGSLEGHVAMSRGALDTELTLRSKDAKVRMTKDTFETSLALGVTAKGTADATKATIDVAGTFVELDDSLITTRSGETSKPWRTRFEINEGDVAFTLPEEQNEETGVVGFWSLFQKQELKSMLSNVDGHAKGKLEVSDLDWVTVLFKKPFSLDIAQSAEVDADLTIAKGRLTADSSLAMAPTTFTLGILDYIVEGTGGFALAIARADAKPDLSLTATLGGASLRLEDEKTAVVSDVTINVVALAQNVTAKEGGESRRVEMTIPTAKITDMSAYNAYLGPKSPIKLLNGTGTLSAKLLMIGDNSTTGFMKLTTSTVDADIRGDRISGVIDIDVKIPGGSAAERRFNLAGSKLSLSNVQMTGRRAIDGWSGDITIGKGSVVWKKPMTLDMSASLHMKDAQPILAIFQANRKEHKWLDKLLDLRNINGQFTLRVAPDSIVVPYAFATSNTFDVGAKGIFGASGDQGVFYARTGKLAGVLSIENGDKKFGLIDATRKFEAYKPGGPVPGISDAPKGPAHVDVSAPVTPPQPAAKPKKQPFSLFKRKQ